MIYIDTHCHLDGTEFADDRADVVARAREAGCGAVLLPAIDLASCQTVMDVCRQFPGYCFPMLGLHPEEVRADWRDTLEKIRQQIATSLEEQRQGGQGVAASLEERSQGEQGVAKSWQEKNQKPAIIAIGEVGLDYYWSREFEQEQLLAFEEQVKMAADMQLPLMIHCRKAQNEMVAIVKRYADRLPGGVFHCFTGNETEARQLLEFPNFLLGIGGVLTFKKSHLPETLAAVVPLERIVLETDAPYMAPVPMRGQRNEPSFIAHVIDKLAEVYQTTADAIAAQTTQNAFRLFGIHGVGK